MIPTIESILTDLVNGDISKPQAHLLIQQHIDAGMAETRDYFAGQAMMGMVADIASYGGSDSVAKNAYQVADAMLRVREV